MKKFLITVLVMISILPSIPFLLWGFLGWIMALGSLVGLKFDPLALLIFVIVPGGFVGIGGIITLAIKVAVEEQNSELSKGLIFSLSYGAFSALVVGILSLAWNWVLIGVVVAPLGITIYLLHLYRKNSRNTQGETAIGDVP